ncbi:MAG: hypothetical protein LJE67_10155 [Salaquimonas sp.]|nr:hypothetical protein [Salaquimonas sp.]
MIPIPKGFVVGSQNRTQDVLVVEWVPEGQSAENWTDMITMQTLYGRGDLKPFAFEKKMVSEWTINCPATKYQPIRDGVENGYTFSFWLLSCEKNPKTGKPDFTMMKAMQGNDSFYTVQRAFKSQPAKDTVVNWSNFMSQIRVCDTRLPDRECPKGN